MAAFFFSAGFFPSSVLAKDEMTAKEKEEALNYFKKGSSAFEEEDYRRAIDWFRKSFELARSPELVYNIGRCYEELGQTDQAIYHYEMYLRFYPTSEEAEEARHRINMLREVDERGPDEAQPPPAQGEEESLAEVEPGAVTVTQDATWYSDLALLCGLRFAVGLSEPTDAPVLGLGIGGELPIHEWLTAWADFFFGGYLGEEKRGLITKLDRPKSQVGFAAGLGTRWNASELLTWGLGVGFSIASVSLEHTRLTWPAGEVFASGVYRIKGGWGITARLFGIFGPLYGGPAAETGVEIGIMGGVSYTFGTGSEG